MSDPFKECLALCDKIGRDLDDCSDMVREASLSLDRIKDNLRRTVLLCVAFVGIFPLIWLAIITAAIWLRS